MKIRVGKNKIASLYYIASSFITKAMLFLITPIISHSVTPDEYGVYVIFTSYLGIVSVFTTLEMSGAGIYRELSKRESHRGFIFSLLLSQAALSLISLFIYLSLRDKINSFTSLTTPLSVLLILEVFFNSVEGLYLAESRYLLKYRRVALFNVARGALSAVLAILFIVAGGLSGEGRIYAELISSLVFVLPIIAIILFSKVKPERGAFAYFKRTLLPLLPHYISLSVMAQAGRIVVQRTLGDSFVGSYGAACALSLSIALVTVGLSNALLPWINRNFCIENATRVVGTIKLCTTLVLGITFLFLLISPILYRFLYPPEYLSALPALYPLTLGQVFLFLSNVYGQILFRFERVKQTSAVSVAGALCCVFLSFILVGPLSLFGVATAFFISEALTVLIKGAMLFGSGIKAYRASLLPFVSSLLFFASYLLAK